jgi:hypothetical protein
MVVFAQRVVVFHRVVHRQSAVPHSALTHSKLSLGWRNFWPSVEALLQQERRLKDSRILAEIGGQL